MRIAIIGATGMLNYPGRLNRYEAAGAHLGHCARRQPDCHRAVIDTLGLLALGDGRVATPAWRSGPALLTA